MQNLIIQLLPLMFFQSLYAIFIYLIAKRMKNSPASHVVLSMIPVFGFLYFIYFFFYKVFKVIFDRLEKLELEK